MTKSELKKLFERYQYDKDYINEILKEIKIYNEKNEKYKSYLNNGHSILKNKDIELIIKKHEDDIKNMLKIKSNNNYIESLIQQLEQPYRNVLFYKYIKYYSFDEIASKMHYSTPRIYQLHDKALNLILIKDTEKN